MQWLDSAVTSKCCHAHVYGIDIHATGTQLATRTLLCMCSNCHKPCEWEILCTQVRRRRKHK
jgi:hypothetical protein